uniref:Uncharacterized protein n=1 Tax=Amphimedon queenslandica TaxID=400682 RepID=A0A1X7VQA3_AMPQE
MVASYSSGYQRNPKFQWNPPPLRRDSVDAFQKYWCLTSGGSGSLRSANVSTVAFTQFLPHLDQQAGFSVFVFRPNPRAMSQDPATITVA